MEKLLLNFVLPLISTLIWVLVFPFVLVYPFFILRSGSKREQFLWGLVVLLVAVILGVQHATDLNAYGTPIKDLISRDNSWGMSAILIILVVGNLYLYFTSHKKSAK